MKSDFFFNNFNVTMAIRQKKSVEWLTTKQDEKFFITNRKPQKKFEDKELMLVVS
jgi:hypothetical protein